MTDRWKCQECAAIVTEYLTGPNPFDATDTIIGCPNCKCVDTLLQVCDEPECNQLSSCGFPTPTGYRRTCGKHYIHEATK